jgi:shikimate 5-dehydrogenase
MQLARNGYAGISGPCFKIGATNLVVKTAEGLMFHNSDFSGIILSVAEACIPGVVGHCYDVYGEKGYIKVHQFVKENLDSLYGYKPQALIVGCGGAGRAAAVAAAEMGFATALMNRTHKKAQALAADLPEYGFIPVPISDFPAALEECDLVIYTLPVALEEIAGLSADDLVSTNGAGKRILEANYRQPSFDGAAQFKTAAAGGEYLHGRRWLLYQALAGYGLMTGRTPDLDALEKESARSAGKSE